MFTNAPRARRREPEPSIINEKTIADFTRAGFGAMIDYVPAHLSTFRCLAAIVGTMCASCV
jgi:hypothetical protein